MNISVEQATAPIAPDVSAVSLVNDKSAVTAVARVLGNYLYRYSCEIDLQDRMQEVLEGAGYAVGRERILDSRSRIDLWLDGIVVEVKVDGSLSSALRQIGRYMKHPDVRGIVLASTERWASQPLSHPPEWGGKPFVMFRVRRQSL